MTAKWNVALSLSAGLLGGMISHWAFPVSAQAQAQGSGGSTPSNPPRVIEAESFALVDASGKVTGTLTMDRADAFGAYIKLTDAAGHEIWRSLDVRVVR